MDCLWAELGPLNNLYVEALTANVMVVLGDGDCGR